MAPLVEQHHHRTTTKHIHKPFKSRHATKSALKERSKGKIEVRELGVRRTPHQQVMSKLDRRNRAKQLRLTKDQERMKATSVFSGKDGAPRIVAIIPLCEDVSSAQAVASLNSSLDIEQQIPEVGWVRTNIERFKQRIQYLLPRRDLFTVLDASRTADFVVFVLSAQTEVDQLGELCIRSLESQGISNTLAVVQNLDSIDPPKRRPQIAASLKSFITHFFPTIEKVHSLDASQDAVNIIRHLCTTTPKGIRWREDRSWMMVEDVRWPGGKNAVADGKDEGEVVLTGIVRGKSLKADRLVQLGDFGAFQIEKVASAPLDTKKKGKKDGMEIEAAMAEETLDLPTEDRDSLLELAPEEAVMEDATEYPMSLATTARKGVMIDDHHYFDDDDFPDEESMRPKRLPRGTSNYQSAWYLDNVSDSGSDLEDIEEDAEADLDMAGPADPADGSGSEPNPEATEAGPSEYPQSEMFLDPSPEDEAEQLAQYRKSRKTEAEEDFEFPDEMELHPSVLARERLAKYRGLKSLKTSPWEGEEDKAYEPQEWPRLLQVENYKAAKSRVMREALVGGVKPGTRVKVHLKGVPLAVQRTHDPQKPLAMFSLLRHEHKRTCVNSSITLSTDFDGHVRSKEELILQCGPRRLVVRPLFSQPGTTPNDVHKFNRYIHPGQAAVASFLGPLTWGSAPALWFKRQPGGPSHVQLIGTGTSLAPSTSRVIAKRVVLTGHPYKIHKRVVTVRYMFFNKEDVAWFKALQLWTKRGRSGWIKESLGTHGYFKAMFDGRMNAQDAVGVSLYKRVWPRWAELWRDWEQQGDGAGAGRGDGDAMVE